MEELLSNRYKIHVVELDKNYYSVALMFNKKRHRYMKDEWAVDYDVVPDCFTARSKAEVYNIVNNIIKPALYEKYPTHFGIFE